MGIQFPPIAFLYLLYFYICIYIFICTLVKRIIKLKLKLIYIISEMLRATEITTSRRGDVTNARDKQTVLCPLLISNY